MAHYDITHLLARYFDRHMVLPLLEFIHGKNIYDDESLLSGKQEVLESTKMVDYSADVHKARFQQEPPQSMLDKRAEVLLQMKELEAEVECLVTIFRDNQTASVIKDGAQLVDYLQKNGYKMDEVYDNLYNCAKFHYECGNYSRSSQYLYFLRTMLPSSNKNFMNALWGKLASDILMQDWDAAIEDIMKLKEILDNNPSPPLVLLQQRTWLIHWSLFVYFNHNKGHDYIIDIFLYNNNYLNAIQTMCPHILRYMTSAVITNRKRRQDHPQLIKDLVKVLTQETYTYKDPITEFVECLYVKFDFDGAQTKLKECEDVLSNDFFLVGCFNDFIENARLLIFETFCKIHCRTSIAVLADKLNMKKEDEAERWAANLINNTKLRAKIDSKEGLLLIDSQPTNAYQQAVDKTKTYSMRTQATVMNIDKKFAPKAENQWND